MTNIKAGDICINKKSGDKYSVLGIGTDKTNGRNDELIVIYCKYKEHGSWYVRTVSEFAEKFSN